MKIVSENKIINGMFIYDSSSIFTQKDLVIEDGVIYVCHKEASGKRPSESPEYYTVYLGDQSISPAEFLDFLETGEGSNKYLSVGMLQTALSHYMVGPTGKGVIGDYVYYSKDTFQVCISGSAADSYFSDPYTVLSQIMVHPEINHGMFRVSRLLPEIYGYVGDPNLSQFTEEDDKSCILRQYTYLKEETGTKIRIQELIDQVSGLIWYRSANFGSSGGSWKCSVVNSYALKEKAEAILGLYTARLKVLSSLESHLKSNFRYRRLELKNKKATLVMVSGKSEVSLLISETQSSGLTKNYQVSINLEDGVDLYKVSDSLILIIGGGSIRLGTLEGGKPSEAWISSAYYKEYYGES